MSYRDKIRECDSQRRPGNEFANHINCNDRKLIYQIIGKVDAECGYLGPKGSVGAPFSAEGPGLETEALFTCPLPPDPAEVPRVTSDTAVAKLMSPGCTKYERLQFD